MQQHVLAKQKEQAEQDVAALDLVCLTSERAQYELAAERARLEAHVQALEAQAQALAETRAKKAAKRQRRCFVH